MSFEQLSQQDPKWADIKLGWGSGTIGNYGCTLTALAMFAGLTPDVLNTMLRGSSFEDSAFAGDTKNLINWTKLEKYTGGLIKFHWRGWGYQADKVKEAIEKRSACLVEVDFDGTGPKQDKHWILALGNQRANDPWTGNEIPTNKYPIWTGWAEIEVNREIDMSDEYGNMVYKSEQHDKTVKSLFGEDKNPREYSSETIIDLFEKQNDRIEEQDEDIFAQDDTIDRLEIDKADLEEKNRKLTHELKTANEQLEECLSNAPIIPDTEWKPDGKSETFLKADGGVVTINYAIKDKV